MIVQGFVVVGQGIVDQVVIYLIDGEFKDIGVYGDKLVVDIDVRFG